MEKHVEMPKQMLKRIELFRERQRKTVGTDDEQLRQHQYRELQEILSPFWAWRSGGR